jgi:class 3 adenylate cyclase
VGEFSFEAWVRDLETVVDTLGLERFPLLGISQGGPVAITYAVRHPERVSHLVLYGSYAQGRGKRGLPQAELDERDAMITLARVGWGRENPVYRHLFAGSFVPGGTPEQHRWFTDLCRVSTSPENAVRFMQVFDQIDVEDLLPQVSVPTLVLHTRNDQRCSFEWGRRLAAGIPGARFVSLEGQNHIILEDEPAWPHFLREVRAFLGVDESGHPAEDEGVHTILFTDVEGSTELTRRLGDRQARALLREHENIVREALQAHGGLEVKSMGDGFMVSFPSAARALECAIAIQRALAVRGGDGLRVRIGLNAGEPISERGDLFGSAVNLAARIADAAGGGEILVSDVVRQLVSGKGFAFAERGETALKGFEEPVRLFEVHWRE